MFTHTCDLSTRVVEEGGSEVQGQPWLHSKFKVSLEYLGPSLKLNKQHTGINKRLRGL